MPNEPEEWLTDEQLAASLTPGVVALHMSYKNSSYRPGLVIATRTIASEPGRRSAWTHGPLHVQEDSDGDPMVFLPYGDAYIVGMQLVEASVNAKIVAALEDPNYRGKYRGT